MVGWAEIVRTSPGQNNIYRRTFVGFPVIWQMHGVGEKVAATVHRELSREVFPGENVDFFRWVRAFSTNSLLGHWSTASAIETVWRSCQGKANFFRPGRARNHAQHSWRSWARLLTSEGGRLKRRSLPQRRGARDPDRADDCGSLEELRGDQGGLTCVICL